MTKKNCWEEKECGREPGGKNIEKLGLCPAAADELYDGTNSGKNAGRICWYVAGSLCGSEKQGTFAEKILSCTSCDFYWKVMEEEGQNFKVNIGEEKIAQNCWEIKNCGRQPGGVNVEDLGVCPAAIDTVHHGANNGTSAGRICWQVAGTFCGGKVQGSFADKRDSCESCHFFIKVSMEEGKNFKKSLE